MEYMVSASFRPQDNAEIASLIPREQARIGELREMGIVTALYISAERSRVWLVMKGESQDLVQQSLQSLPLHPYMEALEMVLLAKMREPG